MKSAASARGCHPPACARVAVEGVLPDAAWQRCIVQTIASAAIELEGSRRSARQQAGSREKLRHSKPDSHHRNMRTCHRHPAVLQVHIGSYGLRFYGSISPGSLAMFTAIGRASSHSPRPRLFFRCPSSVTTSRGRFLGRPGRTGTALHH
jgi:hypothetical protein